MFLGYIIYVCYYQNTRKIKILFDADKLDAIGSVGIARCFMLAGQFGQSLLTNELTNDYICENTTENGRLKDISKHSPFIEYEVKFKNIPSRLYTKKAKEIGFDRLEFKPKTLYKSLANSVSK